MSSDLPLVCICIPTYNAATTIMETLESVLAQTYPNLVVQISDNASSDETLEIVGSVIDSRIHIHRQERNIGAEGNFNRCIQLAEGKYTAIFHADDIYEPHMVAKQVSFLESHPEAGAVFTEASLIDEMGRKFGEIRIPRDIDSENGLYDFSTMFKAVLRHSNFFICPSFMVRTNIYQQEIRIWRGDLFGSGADLDVWLRILQKHPIGHLPERLMRYRISKNQFSARIRLEIEKSIIFKIIDHYLEQDRVKSLINADDLLSYSWLERRDRLGRAINLVLIDRPAEAERLLRDVYSWDALRAAFKSKRGLLTLILGVYVRLIIAFGMNKFGKKTFNFMKQVTNR